jgi:hypothetical protein
MLGRVAKTTAIARRCVVRHCIDDGDHDVGEPARRVGILGTRRSFERRVR